MPAPGARGRPAASVIMDLAASVRALLSYPNPSVRGVPSTIETAATAGMVRSMVASAEPSAKFWAVCKR